MTSALPMTQRGREAAPSLSTPCLELDVPAAVGRFVELAATLPGTAVHYALKADPNPELLAKLAADGCRFDVASPAEVRAALAAGATARTLVYSNPVKRRDHVVKADEAVEILLAADELGLEAAGVCFHVGSQQRDPEAWAGPITAAAHVFELLREQGLSPRLLDLGGGFPVAYDGGCRPVSAYRAAIERHLLRAFGEDRPQTIVEPGRAVVGDGGPTGPCVLAGPTCDSADVLYEHQMVQLPVDLAEGDEVRLLSAGAYTNCFSSVGFNGFGPLRTLTRAA